MSGLTRGVALVAAVALLAAVPLSARGPVADAASDPMAFWSTPRHGANGGLSHLRPEWFEGAATAGIEWVRLHPDTHTAAEREFGFEDPGDPAFAAWFEKIQGTPADLDRFTRRIVSAIREVDPDTPILLRVSGERRLDGARLRDRARRAVRGGLLGGGRARRGHRGAQAEGRQPTVARDPAGASTARGLTAWPGRRDDPALPTGGAWT